MNAKKYLNLILKISLFVLGLTLMAVYIFGATVEVKEGVFTTDNLTVNNKVGIGTATPGYKLDVQGGWIHLTGTGSFGDPATRIGIYDSDNTGGVSGWWFSQNQDGKMAIHQNGIGDRLTIDGAGNVGIGTTSPESQLQLSAPQGNAYGALRMDTSGGSPTLTNTVTLSGVGGGARKDLSQIKLSIGSTDVSNYQGNIFFFTTPSAGILTERMRIDQAGNVGIGTASPSGLLHVKTPATAFSATGGTITTSGGYTIHTFTSSGTFTPNGPGNVEYLVVGGGGGGGGARTTSLVGNGAGGGAGGFRTGTGFAVTAQGYSITVGAGGAGGGVGPNGPATAGGNSAFSTITSTGGGPGSGYDAMPATCAGGSGGGDVYVGDCSSNLGTAGQGNDGGGSGSYGGGGGGGASAVGVAGTGNGGNGGAGTASSISGSSVTYGGGGGGGTNGATAGTGGAGGGGGGSNSNSAGNAGTANTGGGGGGGGNSGSGTSTGGAGGSGIVIIRYSASSVSADAIFVNSINGNVGIGTTTPGNILTVVQNSATDPIADAWTVYSSRRWKKNIQPIDGALDKVLKLNGVTFDWKANDRHDIGMIAEDVGKIIPEVVEYEENGTDAKSLNYDKLVAVLVEALKEQQKKQEQQQEQLNKQQAQMEKQQEEIETLKEQINRNN